MMNNIHPRYRNAVFGAVALVAIVVVGVWLYSNRSDSVSVIPAITSSTTSEISASPATIATSTTTKPKPKPPVSIIPDPTPLPVGTDRFVVSLSETNDDVADDLLSGNYITSTSTFINLLTSTKTVQPGGYKISNTMTPAQLVKVLYGKPYMVWVVIPEGLRKEEIADLLAKALGWSKKVETHWITVDTTQNPDYKEGVYFPNTYLIPVDEAPADVATRITDKFNEEFAPALSGFQQQNIKWTKGLTLASIVQREAANDADMPLIAGILWNRLNQGMALDVDATLQYVRGNTGAGWWAPITVADKQIDSPYNTYKYKGLPPGPISNPGLAAINAVLNPTQTDCLYYLHDSNHVDHCAATYAEHEANIQKYLVNNVN